MTKKRKAFLGYGSPAGLEAAIKAVEDEHFMVVKETICFAVVCSDLPEEAVEARMRSRPCGTSGGWQLCKEGNPVACNEKPTHKHYLFEA